MEREIGSLGRAVYLWRDVEGPVGDVKVPYHEDEEGHD